MATKRLKIFIIVLSSSLLFFGALKTIEACGGFDWPDVREYSVFTPEIIHQPDKTPFFVSHRNYYSHEGYVTPETAPTMTERNTNEWFSFFNSKIKTEDLEWFIYNSSVHHIELIRRNFAGENVKIDSLNKPFLSQIKSEKNILEALDYLIMAKRVEKYFNPDYSSWDTVSYDSLYIKNLVPVFKQSFLQAKNPFLKNRYGFQLTRALSIGGRYTECIDFFDNLFKPGTSAGSMYYRSLGFKARALYKMKNYSEANYIYSQMYEHDPCSKYLAFRSFHPQEEADWNATLKLAQSPGEKEVLWHLLGIYADPVRGMKEIYSLNPKSDLLPLLLVRAVNLAEESSLNNTIRYGDFNYEDYSTPQVSEIETVFKVNIDSAAQKPLIGFINKVVSERNVVKMPVWQLSSAYLLVLNGSYRPAADILSKITIDSGDSLMLGQAEIIKGILATKRINSIDPATEKLIYGHLQKIRSFRQPELRNENAIRYMLSRLSLVYDKKGDALKRELCYPRGQKYYQSAAAIQQMIDFMSRKNLNDFERFILNEYPLALPDLYEVKAVALIYEYNFKAAIGEFDKAKGAGSQELYGNPFNIHIVDCHDCDHMAPQSTKYTKFSFAKKMLELKAKGDTAAGMEERAQNYFLYANGIYNMTWYGNGRMIHGTRVAADDHYSLFDNSNSKAIRKSNFFNCQEALAFYQKALSLSKNKEFKAKCAWMSAKCEHNLWLDGLNNETTNKDFVAGKYFNQVKKEFTDTKYYQEVINECGYFCTYITRSEKCIRFPESLNR